MKTNNIKPFVIGFMIVAVITIILGNIFVQSKCTIDYFDGHKYIVCPTGNSYGNTRYYQENREHATDCPKCNNK